MLWVEFVYLKNEAHMHVTGNIYVQCTIRDLLFLVIHFSGEQTRTICPVKSSGCAIFDTSKTSVSLPLLINYWVRSMCPGFLRMSQKTQLSCFTLTRAGHWLMWRNGKWAGSSSCTTNKFKHLHYLLSLWVLIYLEGTHKNQVEGHNRKGVCRLRLDPLSS